MRFNHKAEMGVGTLIIFIAMLLVAAVAAGVLLQTGGSLQERSLSVGQQARTQISTNARAIEVSGTDSRDGTVEDLTVTYKLAPGSDAIKLSDALLSESTQNTTTSLKLRENALPLHDVWLGYYTAARQTQPSMSGAYEEAVPNDFQQTFAWSQTSEMMAGKIAIAIVFVESNGSVDTDFENWTRAEQDEVINKTTEALNWWADREPRADLQFTYEIYRDVPISYEPVTRDTGAANQDLWIHEALDGIGAPAGADRFVRSTQFDDSLRTRMNSHWSFIMFMVDSSETGGGFTDGYAGIAYLNGPYTFMANNAFGPWMEAMIAHEFAHIFGANDEYQSSGCACTDTAGYFPIETQNCDMAGCMINETSIMRGGIDTVIAYNAQEVDVFALAQMGLIDADANFMLDPVDILFGDSGSTANMSQSTIDGLATDGYPTLLENVGFYAKDYLQEGTSHRDNNLQRGDIATVRFRTARPIATDESVRLTFTPKTGQSTLTQFITPDVLSVQRTYLYP
jgi:flagellin-like protein